MVLSFGENNNKDDEQFTPTFFSKNDVDKLLKCINKSYSMTMNLFSGLVSLVLYMHR